MVTSTGDRARREDTLAIMQPYLYPYAGYFRLIAVARTFVIYDDVQFPRRGRVHRCHAPGRNGDPEWLTLPLAHKSRDTLIRDLEFAPHARATLDERLLRFPWLLEGTGPLAERVRAHLFGPLESPVAFIEAGLRLVANALELPTTFVRSSEAAIDSRLRGQDRILALVEALGGRAYVNAPNGRDLYAERAFAERGIRLDFLRPYDGGFPFLLRALVENDPTSIRTDILTTATFASER